MRRLFRLLPLLVLPVAASLVTVAEQPASPETSAASQELIEHEKIRSAIESTVTALARGTMDFDRARQTLVALGPSAVPFVQAEMIGLGKATTYLLMATVLGDMKTEASLGALRELVTRADQAAGPMRNKKKIWACYGLAVAGQTDAVDLLNSGQLKTAAIHLFESATAIEVIGALTAPASIPRLFDQAQAYDKVAEMEPQLVAVLDTLSRIADPATRPRILPYLEHSSPLVRAAAARALGRLGDTAAVAPLVRLLSDPAETVRVAAADGLLDLPPEGKSSEIVARLDAESELSVRTPLYRVLAAISGESAIAPLRGYYSQPERSLDRRFIVNAVTSIKSVKGYPLLRTALEDPDVSLAIHAATGLGEIGGAGATETLLARIADRRWPVAQSVIRLLAAQREPRAASRIADRLFREYLSAPLTDVHRWDDVTMMGDALVALRHVEAIEPLREAIKIQTDPTVLRRLDGILRRLSAIQDNGGDVGKWIAAASSEDQALRRVAYSRLGEIGGDAAAKGLAEAFPSAKIEDEREMLRALGEIKSSATAAALIERVLLDGAYDPNEAQHETLRAMAAYSARRLGGAKMIEALRKSAERRGGQDAEVLVYLAVAAGKEALPTLNAVRIERLRHPSTERGIEQVRVDWMIRELAAGRPLESVDLPPERLHQH